MTTIDRTAARQPDAIQFLSVDGERIAYRRLGPPEGTPLVLLQRFRGTLDHWDPLLLAALSATRPVVAFDSLGVGRSGGIAPDDIHGMADFAAEFLRRLGHRQADLLVSRPAINRHK